MNIAALRRTPTCGPAREITTAHEHHRPPQNRTTPIATPPSRRLTAETELRRKQSTPPAEKPSQAEPGRSLRHRRPARHQRLAAEKPATPGTATAIAGCCPAVSVATVKRHGGHDDETLAGVGGERSRRVLPAGKREGVRQRGRTGQAASGGW